MNIEIPAGRVQSARITYSDKGKMVIEIFKYVFPYDIETMGIWASDNCYAKLKKVIHYSDITAIEWLGVAVEEK